MSTDKPVGKPLHELRRIVANDARRFGRLSSLWNDLSDDEQDRLLALAEKWARAPVVRDPEAWQAVAAEGRRFA